MVDPIVAPAPARVVAPGRGRCRVIPGSATVGARPIVPVVYPQGHEDVLLIVETPTNDHPGRRLAELRGAVIDKPTWVLNGVGPMGIGCSASNEALDHLQVPGTVVDGKGVMRLIGREFQHYRDGVLDWQGPGITARLSTDGNLALSCMDAGWHLYRKFFGAAERRDLLLGIGSMDAMGLPGWTVRGCTKSRDTVDKQRGASSMALTGTGSVSASFSLPARKVVPVVHLTGVFKVPDGTPVGTALATITVRTTSGTVIDRASITVTESTVFDEWQRATTYARQQTNTTQTVEVTLWSPGTHGATKFDDVRPLENNTTGLTPGRDLVDHARAGLHHIQADVGQGSGFGFGFGVVTPTGTVEVMGERHLNHTQFQDFLTKYTSRADGFDWWIDHQTRRFMVSARRGVDHRNLTLDDRTVRQGGGWTLDETAIAAKVVVPGDGDGVDRPEGGYTNASRTAGIVYDDFFSPPADTPLSAIDSIARQRWDEVSQPQYTFDELGVSEDLLGEVNPGDTVSGTFGIGKFRLPFDRPVRVGQVALDIDAGQLALS
jgi:hypothetical protein